MKKCLLVVGLLMSAVDATPFQDQVRESLFTVGKSAVDAAVLATPFLPCLKKLGLTSRDTLALGYGTVFVLSLANQYKQGNFFQNASTKLQSLKTDFALGATALGVGYFGSNISYFPNLAALAAFTVTSKRLASLVFSSEVSGI